MKVFTQKIQRRRDLIREQENKLLYGMAPLWFSCIALCVLTGPGLPRTFQDARVAVTEVTSPLLTHKAISGPIFFNPIHPKCRFSVFRNDATL